MKITMPNLVFINELIAELNTATATLNHTKTSYEHGSTIKDKTTMVVELSKLTGLTAALAQEATLLTQDFNSISNDIIKKTLASAAAKDRASGVLADVISPKKMGLS